MKLKRNISNVDKFIYHNNHIYYKRSKNLFFADDNQDILFEQDINTMIIYGHYLLVTNKDYKFLKIINGDYKIKDGHFSIESAVANKDFIVIPTKIGQKRSRYIFDKCFNYLRESIWPVSLIYLNNLIQIDYPNKIYVYDIELNLKSQTDVSQIGEYIKMDGKKAPNNEIEGELMGSETSGLIYVPMAGGQLIALKADSGKISWICQTKYNGRYTIYKDKLYKVSDKLYEIDAKTGKILKQKEYNEITIRDFVPSGPVWAYDDMVILLDVRGANIILIDRNTFEIAEFVHIPNIPGIAHSKDVIVWHNNKLYVLDMEQTLHIFEKA